MLLQSLVGGSVDVTLDQVDVVQPNSEHDCLGELVVADIDFVGGSEELLVFRVSEQVDHADHVQADSSICVLVNELGNVFDDLQLAHEIDRIGFSIVTQEIWHQ